MKCHINYAIIFTEIIFSPETSSLKSHLIINFFNFPDVVCDDGWFVRAGVCYKLFEIPNSYKEALQLCANSGAEMVSIHSAEEEKFIVEIVTGSVVDNMWIGKIFKITSSQQVFTQYFLCLFLFHEA